MNEITRIHIAKVPYDIETAAKKEISEYIKLLEKYADDTELFNDIEIRITELLGERGIKVNGVITSEDVKAIRKQLGEPKEFLGDKDIDAESEIEVDDTGVKKLYRDTDNAILGGVLSGMASYFQIDPVWVRLLFVILFLMTSGAAFFVYIVFWIVVPPAKTTAEKIQMTGKPVNIESIRELNESEPKMAAQYEKAGAARRVISIMAGTIFLIMSVGTLMFTIFAALGIGHFNPFQEIQVNPSWEVITAYILAIVAGVLLSILFAVFAYTSFIRKFSNRVAVAVVAVIITGLVSFGTAVGLVAFNAGDQIQRNLKETSISVPDNFANINTLTINSELMNVNYIVDGTTRVVLQSLFDDKRPVVSVSGTDAIINYNAELSERWPRMNPVLTIYGPKLSSLIVKHGGVSYKSQSQDLAVEASGNDSTVDLKGGEFSKLTLNLSDKSSIDASDATVQDVIINQRTGSNASLGTVKSLSIVQPDVCSINDKSSVKLKGVNAGSVQYNGNAIKAETYTTNCGSIIVDNLSE